MQNIRRVVDLLIQIPRWRITVILATDGVNTETKMLDK